MKKILVVGAGISQVPTYDAAKKIGFKTIGTDGNPDALAKDKPDYFEVVDIRDPEAVLEVAEKYKIDGIVVPGTDFPVTGAYIAEKMKLPGIPVDVAETCSNKYKMREVLQQNGFLVPSFQKIKVNSYAEMSGRVIDVNKSIKYPAVVKPFSSMAARGVRKVNNPNELFVAMEVAYRFDKRIIIEEFESGMEFSLDSLVLDGEVFTFAFADRHFMLDPYFIEIGHTTPTILDKGLVKQVTKVYENAVKTLGITHGAAKGDIKITSRGIVIGEIAARISGGFLSGWTVPYTTMYEEIEKYYYPHEDLLRIAVGEKIKFPKIKNVGYSAERTILSIPGKAKSISTINSDYYREELIHMHVKEGQTVCFPVNNTNRCGSVLTFAAEDRNSAISNAREITREIFIRLEPHNTATEKFLSGNDKFMMFIPGRKEEDWHGMDIQDALQKVIKVTGRFDFIGFEEFWKAFYKGGAQGGTYWVDTHLK